MRGYCTRGRLFSCGCSRQISTVHGKRGTCPARLSPARPRRVPGWPGWAQGGWGPGSFCPPQPCRYPVTHADVYPLRFSNQGDLKSELCTETPLPGPGQDRSLSGTTAGSADPARAGSHKHRASKVLLDTWPLRLPPEERSLLGFSQWQRLSGS